ncbi:MAG: hypothetical protein AAF821_08080 [Cyanobacteria bacterium P01_D01_bin.156]
MAKKNARELIVKEGATQVGTTWIKQQPNPDEGMLTESEKFQLQEKERISLVSYDDEEIQDHYKIELAQPVNGLVFWYAYKPHVQIIE